MATAETTSSTDDGPPQRDLLMPHCSEDELFERACDGDERASGMKRTVSSSRARSLALRYQRSGEPFDDLLQVASLGLVKAIDRFDCARGIAFSSYAVPTILGEIKRYFRDKGWAVRVPR